jgi:ferritin-like metal-binding protein YciE
METMTEALRWVGREAQDPWDTQLGTIVAVVPDEHGGAPEWLVVAERVPGASAGGGAPSSAAVAAASAAGGGAADGALVPIRGAEPTGARIRVTASAALVDGAPWLRAGAGLAPAERVAARARYGIGPGGAATVELVAPAETDPSRRRALVDALRTLHAGTQGELRELAAMRWRARDEELVHDLALHHKEVNRHAAAIRTRLEQLGARPSWRRDAIARTAAYLAAQPPRLLRHPEARDALALLDGERRQAQAWEEVERLAREAGDTGTAALADAIAADERAMVARLAANWERWTRVGPHAVGASPFAPPAALDEQAPRT